jgi:DNA-binding LytR/AlgR family response regulator
MPGEAVFVREGAQHVRLPVNEILYAEAADNSTHLHTMQRSYTVPRMLKDVLAELPPARLERVHRSYAVNMAHVRAVSDNGLHVGERWLPIGRSFREGVRKRLRLL